ncbi:MAG: hypothetical protein GY950_22825, partial [bacterium]|nr:hypothetical protein [bacterium]
MPEQEIKNRKLVIIDDQLFKAVNGTGREPTDADKLKYSFTLRKKKDREALTPLQKKLNKKWRYLYNIISHINKGNFYGLTELIIYDLNLAVLEKEIFKRDTEAEQKDIQQYAILIDIYSERDRYPTGMDIAEGLDQTPFTDRIAWLSVTGNLSSELKPYPLIRKREIPTCKAEKNSGGERDTLF